VEVRPTDGGTSDLENDVAIFDDDGFGDID
jgi:hypothetical protein